MPLFIILLLLNILGWCKSLRRFFFSFQFVKFYWNKRPSINNICTIIIYDILPSLRQIHNTIFIEFLRQRLKEVFRGLMLSGLDRRSVSRADDCEASGMDDNRKALSLMNVMNEVRPVSLIPLAFDRWPFQYRVWCCHEVAELCAVLDTWLAGWPPKLGVVCSRTRRRLWCYE